MKEFFSSLEPAFSYDIPECSLWTRLRRESRPVYMYGTGNGGDKIVSALKEYGVGLKGVFASPGFERDREWQGYRVESYYDVADREGDNIIVLLAFGTARAEVRDFIERLDSTHTLLIPDVPLYGGGLFNEEYLLCHAEEIKKARALFCDSFSLEMFDALIMFRLTGEYKYLLIAEDTGDSIRRHFGGRDIKNIVDLGAFKGDSAEVFAESFDGVKTIYAFEPDPKTFLKLSDFADAYTKCRIVPLNFAARDTEGTLTFSGSASRGAGAAGANKRAKEKTVEARSVDSFFFENIDFIKYDVEGDEALALKGSLDTVNRCRPSLAVSLYHRTEDFFKLVLSVAEIVGEEYSFFLTRPHCIPFWDLTLYAIKNEL